MAASDLTSLSDVKAYLGLTSDGSDATLVALVTSVSRAIYSALQRTSLLPQAYSETFDGDWARAITLKNWPVTAVSAVTIDGVAIPASPPLIANQSWTSGYVFDPWDGSVPGVMQRLSFRGYRLCPGRQNVIVAYTAGYQVVGEAAVVPSGSGYTIEPLGPMGPWGSDLGVSYANGTPLTLTAGAPSVGQYQVTSDGLYVFASGDTGKAVLLSYGFFPADLCQAALEWTAFRFKYTQNVGWKTKNLGGQESMTVDTSAMSDSVKMMIGPYRRII